MLKSDKAIGPATEKTPSMSDTKSPKETQKNKMEEFFDDAPLRTSPFGGNLPAENCYKRAERITAAVHLMTSHIEHDEPMRQSLRSESIFLLDYALRVQNELRAIESESVRKMNGSIRKLISLVRLAGISGRVSGPNAHIIVDALDDLGSFLVSTQRSSLAESLPLTREDFIPRLEASKKEARQATPVSQKRSKTKYIKDMDIKDKESVRKIGEPGFRASRILDVLKKGGLFGIKDIVTLLPEYSEKMVQRELAAMTEGGKVKKIGEKRWSKYTLG